MKDTNEDYLWDRTGEPDPEIQRLEEVLGTLRYQPQPLEIPAGVKPGNQRFGFSSFGANRSTLFAIAAAIALMLLGVGAWLGLQQRSVRELAKADGNPATTARTSSGAGQSSIAAPGPDVANKAGDNVAPLAFAGGDKPRPRRINPGVINRGVAMANPNRNRRPALEDLGLAASEIKEAEAAKQQLMLALRVASSKLNFAQKKTQGTNPENQIHNQHKIG